MIIRKLGFSIESPKSENNNFKAVPVAKIRGNANNEVSRLVIYSLKRNDLPFLDKMLRNIHMEKLLGASTDTEGAQQWQKLITQAVTNAFHPNVNTFLAVNGNKPCAIMTTLKKDEMLSLNYLAKWNIAKGKEVRMAGKCMMRHFFELFKRSKLKTAKTNPSVFSPVDTFKYYKDLGFYANDERYWEMVFDSEDIGRTINFLDNKIAYKKIYNSKEVNLNKALNIEFSRDKSVMFKKNLHSPKR